MRPRVPDAELQRLLDAGVSQVEIARRAGISQAAISQQKRKLITGSRESKGISPCWLRGYIYIVRIEGGPVKIGMTRNLEKRMKVFEGCNPFPVEILAAIEIDHPYRLETWLLKTYAERQIKGEWFDLEPIEIEELVAFMDEVSVCGVDRAISASSPMPNSERT